MGLCLFRRIGSVICVCSLCHFVSAQNSPPVPSESYRGLLSAWEQGQYSPKGPASFQWIDSGKRYTVLESVQAPAQGEDLVAYDTATGGSRTVLIPAARFIPKGAKEPITVERYSWSADGGLLLVFTKSQKVWRQRTRGDYWVFNNRTQELVQLGGTQTAPSSLMFAKFSPDGREVAYVRENNLYVEDLSSHAIRKLTKDGSADIVNGTSDWVNEEELDIRDGFRWSPDSRSIAFWQFDQAGVQDWTLLDDTSGPVPVARRYHYPQAGTTNSATRIGVVDIAEPSRIRWLKLPGDPREHYVPHMDWVPHSRQIAAEFLDRLQRDDRIYIANADTGDARQIFKDTDPTYVDTIALRGLDLDFTWLPAQGNPDAIPSALLWYSERDGWRHAYSVSLNSPETAPKLLTNFAGDMIAPVAVDVASGSLFFTASPADPIRQYLYRSSLDGSGSPERLTATTESGDHRFSEASPDGRYAVEFFSTVNQAPTFTLTRLSDSYRLRTLKDNADLTRKVSDLGCVVEFTNTSLTNSLSLSTKIIRPPHFDPTKKYPVFTMVYGEAGEQTVLDRFGSGDTFLLAIAREGYVVVSFDNQGTPAPLGRNWRHADYGSIGVLSTQQQADAIRSFAASHTFVDTSRMAIWGWSGGGTNTLNMMFREPGLYSTGISVAPMPDHKRYDTIYKERYMGLPSTNEKGYHDGSAINYTQGLTGNLLIIHGSGDDNDHFAATEDLVNRLIAQGKTFDFMDYPGRSHAIEEGPGTFLHVMTLTARYLEDHVPAGPR